MLEDIPQYIRGGLNIKEKRVIARYRLENENKYWRKDEERVREEHWENLEHMVEESRELRREKVRREVLLGDNGDGLTWMKEFIGVRPVLLDCFDKDQPTAVQNVDKDEDMVIPLKYSLSNTPIEGLHISAGNLN
ncbi:hypothetical protein FQR65_LT02743 [Abscondita terminalis]|nr:hypothetical protein FQR65_LT02743 [Abscondita terminalis]